MSATTTNERIAGQWRFAQVHSAAEFAVKYVVAKFRGSFGELDASLEDGVLSGSVKVASVSVKDQNLYPHLQSPDFFDAEQYPEIKFRSTKIDIQGDNVEIDGELELKGNTRPIHSSGTIEGPVEDAMGNTRLGFTLETKIDRTEFGLNWNAPLPKGGPSLSNEVTLTVELEFHKVA